jgi:hypothetical protein
LVEALPALRARYGEQVAEVVELYRDMALDHRDQPSAQDLKRTLSAIAGDPAAADFTRLDSFTDAALVAEAWKLHRTWRLTALQPGELAVCAVRALARVRSTSGRPKTDALAVALVRDLLEMLPASTPADQRDELLEDALLACGIGASPATLKRLRKKAGQIS